MTKKTVAFEVRADVKDSNESVAELREQFSALREEVDAYKEETDKAMSEMKKGFESASNAAKKTQSGIKNLATGFGKLVKSLGIITLIVGAFAELKNAINRNQESADFFNKAMTVLEVTFSSIVNDGIIPLSKWLGKLFTDPQVALDSFLESTKGVQDWFIDLGKFIQGNFLVVWGKFLNGIDEARISWNELTGDQEEAAELQERVAKRQAEIALQQAKNGELASDIVNSVLDGVNDAFETAKETLNTALAAATTINELEKAAAIGDALRAKRMLEFQAEAELQRQIRDDVSKTVDERIEANDKIGLILDKQIKVEKAAAQSTLDLVNQQIESFGETTDLLVQRIQAETELVDIEERVIGQRSEQLVNLNSLLLEQKELEKELNVVGKSEREIELIELEAFWDSKLDIARRANGDIFEIEAARANAVMALNDKFRKEDVKKEEDRVKKITAEEQKLAKAKMDAAISAANVLGQVANLINQQSQAGVVAAKVLAVAQVAIDTAVAVSGAIAQAQGVPYPGNLVAIGTGVAAVLGAIAQASTILNSTNVPGPSANIPTSISTPSGAAPSTQPVTTATTQFNEEQVNLANIGPIQTFVVETEMTTTQGDISQIQNQATFG
jgi:hypothetical protein